MRTLATRTKEHLSAIRNCNVKASLMASHCVDTGLDGRFSATPTTGRCDYSKKFGS